MAFDLANIEQSKSKAISKETTSFLEKEIVLFRKGFSNKVKEDFYTEVSVLLNAGVNLKETLELLYNSQKNKHNKDMINTMLTDVISGKSLSESVKDLKSFSRYEYYSLKIGEETGRTPEITKQLGDFFSRKNEQRRHLINGLTYPAIIISTALLVVIFMLQFVVPIFQDIFKQQNAELPGITLFVMSLSQKTQEYGWFILLTIVGIIISIVLLKENPKYLKLKDALLRRIPFIGDFIKTVYLSQFTQAVALLTASKVPVVNSIKLVKQMIRYQPLTQALEAIELELLKGKSLSYSLSKHNIFDDKMIALVKVAEETNQTQYMFERLNQQYNTKVQQRSKMLSTVLEPTIILIVGVFVGFILVAMYLPMFELSNVMG
ncbi:type II secretion system F family protein [Winogradskyella haliclonae]|uniref:General secretion pathway protein GspF n=1 Tax=Winogradskyella haliclonae TaxID=2048558 RepID=A0ABQ2BZT2_9FLAO|nr:type II secretion system F family protein [Winogradskyella haliclonae]GGI57734.1 general secretion pathway protein GspF [Winogradskyella haliclonae]